MSCEPRAIPGCITPHPDPPHLHPGTGALSSFTGGAISACESPPTCTHAGTPRARLQTGHLHGEGLSLDWSRSCLEGYSHSLTPRARRTLRLRYAAATASRSSLRTRRYATRYVSWSTRTLRATRLRTCARSLRRVVPPTSWRPSALSPPAGAHQPRERRPATPYVGVHSWTGHGLPDGCIQSLTPSLPPSLPQSLTHRLTHSLTPSLPHSLTPSLPHSLTPSLTHNRRPHSRPLVSKVGHCLRTLRQILRTHTTHSSTHSLTRSLTHSFTHTHTHTHTNKIIRNLNAQQQAAFKQLPNTWMQKVKRFNFKAFSSLQKLFV